MLDNTGPNYTTGHSLGRQSLKIRARRDVVRDWGKPDTGIAHISIITVIASALLTLLHYQAKKVVSLLVSPKPEVPSTNIRRSHGWYWKSSCSSCIMNLASSTYGARYGIIGS